MNINPFINKKIAVLMGGFSQEREISLASGTAVTDALLQKQFNAISVDVDKNIITTLNDCQFDVAFIAMHGRGGEDGTIQGLLEWLQIPYTGSDVLSSALAMDKLKTKQIWQMAKLPTAPFIVLNEQSDFNEVINILNNKVIVKPVREGSSIGMSSANSASSLCKAYQIAEKSDNLVMAEQWIDGDEYTVTIINKQALPIIKVQTSADFYDFEAKYQSNNTKYLIPSGLNKTDTIKIQQLAMDAFFEIGCSGWGRVDIMIDNDGNPWLLEINTVPGMTTHSLVPKAANACGINFPTLVSNILTTATLHHKVYQ